MFVVIFRWSLDRVYERYLEICFWLFLWRQFIMYHIILWLFSNFNMLWRLLYVIAYTWPIYIYYLDSDSYKSQALCPVLLIAAVWTVIKSVLKSTKSVLLTPSARHSLTRFVCYFIYLTKVQCFAGLFCHSWINKSIEFISMA